MRTVAIGRANFNGVAYAPDGRFLVTLNSRRRVRFWDTATFAERLSFWLPIPNWYLSDTLALHGNLLLLRQTAWDVTRAWEVLRQPAAGPGGSAGPPYAPLDLELPRGAEVRSLATDGTRIVGSLALRGYRLRTWDLHGRCQQERPAALAGYHAIGLAPNGRLLAVPWSASYWSRTVALYDLASGEVVARLEHTDGVNHLLFSHDGRLLASAAGRTVWLWDVASQRPVTRFRAFRKYAESLAFHPGGRLLAAGGRDGEVRLWDTTSCKPVTRLDWHIGAVRGLAFAPDGMTMAAAGHAGTLVLWDLD